MNKELMARNAGKIVQLEPYAIRLDEAGRELEARMYDWKIDKVSDGGVVVSNISTGHIVSLGKDQIVNWFNDPDRGDGFGTLLLRVQIFLKGSEAIKRVNDRPGGRVEPPPVAAPRILDVDINFPSDTGLQAELATQGFALGWCRERDVARKVYLEGAEVVEVLDRYGQLTTYRVPGRDTNLILIKYLQE